MTSCQPAGLNVLEEKLSAPSDWVTKEDLRSQWHQNVAMIKETRIKLTQQMDAANRQVHKEIADNHQQLQREMNAARQEIVSFQNETRALLVQTQSFGVSAFFIMVMVLAWMNYRIRQRKPPPTESLNMESSPNAFASAESHSPLDETDPNAVTLLEPAAKFTSSNQSESNGATNPEPTNKPSSHDKSIVQALTSGYAANFMRPIKPPVPPQSQRAMRSHIA